MTELQLDDLMPAIRDFGQELLGASRSVSRGGKDEVERAIRELYGLMKKPAPEVVWLSNPMQLSLTSRKHETSRPLQAQLRHDEELLARRLRQAIMNELGQNSFDQLFNTVWSSLPSEELSMLPNLVEREMIMRARVDSTEPSLRKATEWTWTLGTNTFRGRFNGTGWLSTASPADVVVEWCWRALLKLALAEISRRYLNIPIDVSSGAQLDRHFDFALLVHAHMCFEDVVFLSERPRSVHIDADGRFHNDSGPAISYDGGFEIFCWHGTRVPPYAIMIEPKVSLIDSEQNVEARRVMIERYGVSRFLQDAGASLVHEDDFGRLYRRDLFGDEPLVMVEVKNATPEPDGTRRRFFLRVPPSISSARQAVAWTFSMSTLEYAPIIES